MADEIGSASYAMMMAFGILGDKFELNNSKSKVATAARLVDSKLRFACSKQQRLILWDLHSSEADRDLHGHTPLGFSVPVADGHTTIKRELLCPR